MSSVSILGAGTWGVALARTLCLAGHEITVWSKFEEEVNMLSSKRQHNNLPNTDIPKEILFTTDLKATCDGKEFIICAVPSVFMRSTISLAREYISSSQIIVNVTKGIEDETLYTMSEVIRDEICKEGKHEEVSIVTLSGPPHAEEVDRDMPTAIVSACVYYEVSQLVKKLFSNTCIRVYTSTDIRGVEICGALKNVIALAAGISTGLGYGDNTLAALLTRGLAEIEELGMAMGCQKPTFSGLAGMGDLIVTATSKHSRNNRCGFLIGQGNEVSDAISKVGMIVEGINALPAAMKLADYFSIDMPITRTVNSIINGNIKADVAAKKLMEQER